MRNTPMSFSQYKRRKTGCPIWQIFGENACHPFASLRAGSERSEGSGSPSAEILRCAQDDRQDTTRVRSREVLSPNVWWLGVTVEVHLCYDTICASPIDVDLAA